MEDTPLGERDARTKPLEAVLRLSLARVYEIPPDLIPLLLDASSPTLFRLSSAPMEFGSIKKGLVGDSLRQEIYHLVLAARAFVLACRHGDDPSVEQLFLDFADLGGEQER